MCLASLEELTWIVTKETDFRKKLTAMGLRESKFCKFEELSDDDRQVFLIHTLLVNNLNLRYKYSILFFVCIHIHR
jgi:ABC-type cobalamin/Fe3+-siderophores transport system ATPase subunit